MKSSVADPAAENKPIKDVMGWNASSQETVFWFWEVDGRNVATEGRPVSEAKATTLAEIAGALSRTA
jgi:hypothetical protein